MQTEQVQVPVVKRIGRMPEMDHAPTDKEQ